VPCGVRRQVPLGRGEVLVSVGEVVIGRHREPAAPDRFRGGVALFAPALTLGDLVAQVSDDPGERYVCASVPRKSHVVRMVLVYCIARRTLTGLSRNDRKPPLRAAPKSAMQLRTPLHNGVTRILAVVLRGAQARFRPDGPPGAVRLRAAWALRISPVPYTHAVYYRDIAGVEPVNDFLDALPDATAQAALDNQIDRLNGLPEDAPPLPFPHSSQIDGALRELRCHYGRDLYRVLYRRSGNLFVLLHIFRKDTGKVPRQDVDIATKRWQDFRRRMNAEPRVPPRAAGHDAP
jgi:phage-related protein